MTKQKPETRKKEDGPSFEKSLEELERIVGEMESGQLGLEDMIARFERGQALIKSCSQKLNEVERKIEMLVKKGDEVVVVTFETAEAAETSEAAAAGDTSAADAKEDAVDAQSGELPF